MTPESTRRDSVLARPIRLAGGDDWGFLRPGVRLYPRVVAGLDAVGRPIEHVGVEVRFGYPLEIERLLDGVRSACERGTVQEQYEAFFALATSLLVHAHDIGLAAACELLSVPKEELPRLVREVMAVVSEPEQKPEAKTSGGIES